MGFEYIEQRVDIAIVYNHWVFEKHNACSDGAITDYNSINRWSLEFYNDVSKE